jgi:hypothetical protein
VTAQVGVATLKWQGASSDDFDVEMRLLPGLIFVGFSLVAMVTLVLSATMH